MDIRRFDSRPVNVTLKTRFPSETEHVRRNARVSEVFESSVFSSTSQTSRNWRKSHNMSTSSELSPRCLSFQTHRGGPLREAMIDHFRIENSTLVESRKYSIIAISFSVTSRFLRARGTRDSHPDWIEKENTGGAHLRRFAAGAVIPRYGTPFGTRAERSAALRHHPESRDLGPQPTIGGKPKDPE